MTRSREDSADGSQPTPGTSAKAGTPSFGGAIKWAFVMKWGHQGTLALVTFVLMAILDVEDFGVIGMAWLYILFIEMILDQGFGAAIIQRKDLQQKHKESAFWLVLGVSLVLAGVSVALSGWWASFNSEPRLEAVISVLSIVIPIQGLTTVQVALLQRDMNFRSLAIRNLVSVLVSGTVGIGLALGGFGVWALVTQQIVFAVTALLLLWTLSGWRPRLRFSFGAMKELLGFSTGTFLAKVGVFAATRADEVVVGYFFGAFAVGIYRSAMRLMNMVVDLGTRALGIAAFPKFSRAQGNRDQLRKDLYFCFWLSSLLVIPALALLAAVSDALMLTLGDKWADCADVLKVLCLVGVAQSLTTFQAPMLQSAGRAFSFALVVWGTATVSLAGFIVAGHFAGSEPEQAQPLYMAATRGGLYLLVFLPVAFLIIRSVSGFTVAAFFQAISRPILAAGTSYAAVRGLIWSDLLSAWPSIAQLVVQGCLGVAVSGGILLATDSVLRDKVRSFVGGKLALRAARV